MADDNAVIDDLITNIRDQPAAADILVALIGDRIRAQIGADSLHASAQYIQQRWLSNGTPVTSDSNAIGRDVLGTAQFDTVNVQGGAAYVNASNPRQIDLNLGAGSDCMFDYLISSCFLTLAGFVDGATYTSLSGCTFKGYSTVQAAITAWEASSPTRDGVFYICRGTYAESITTALTSHNRHFFGSSLDSTTIGSGSTTGWRVGANCTDNFYNLTLAASTGSRALHSNNAGGAQNISVYASNVKFAGRIAGDHAGSAFVNCQTDAASGFVFQSNDSPDTVAISTMSVGAAGVDFSACSGASNWDAKELRFTVASTLNLKNVTDSRFDIDNNSAGNATTNVVYLDGNCAGIKVSGHFSQPASGTVAVLVPNGATAYNIQIHAEFDCPTSASAATAYIGTAGTGTFVASEFICTFRRNGSGNFLEDLGTCTSINGLFDRCVFILTPTTTAEVTLAGGSANNFFIGGTLISGSGGSFVGTDYLRKDGTTPLTGKWDQNGAFDIVQRGGNLLVAASKSIQVFSDNLATPLVRTGMWDATSGSIALGSAAPSAYEALFDGRVFADPVTAHAAVRDASGISITADSALAHNFFSLAPAFTTGDASGHTFTGIISGLNTSPTFGINTGTPVLTANDVRGAYLQTTVLTKGKIVDRYGVYVRNAQGGGTLDNQYGVYIENMAKGGTINRAIYSAGGASVHAGNFAFGTTTAPTATVDVTGTVSATSTVTGTAHVASGLTGATAASRYVGATASGAPASGTFAVGDYIIDQTGKLYVCTVAGTPGTWVAVGGAGGTNILLDGSNHTDTTNSAVQRGDVIIGNSTPKWTRLAKGTARQYLTSDGTDVSWSTALGSDIASQKQSIYIPAEAFKAALTNGPTWSLTESTTNKETFGAWGFNDTTEQTANAKVFMPGWYDASTMTAYVEWTSASGSNGVTWGIALMQSPDNSAIDTAYGTEVTIDDTVLTSLYTHITAVSGAITTGGTAGTRRPMYVKLARKVGNANDTKVGDALLLGVYILYGASTSVNS